MGTNDPQLQHTKIWSTTTIEEREPVKQFWCGLTAEERRNLVTIAKDAFLRAMKEQQKNSCSCDMCTGKRKIVRAELEALYNEFEQYANHPGAHIRLDWSTATGPLLESTVVNDDGVISDRSNSQVPATRPHPGIIHKLAADLFDEHGWKIPVTERAECWISRHEDGNITEVGSSDYTKRGTVNGHEYDRSPEERNRKSGGNDIEEYKSAVMTKGKKIDEDKRLFCLFACQMLGQRIQQAYKENAAQHTNEQATLRLTGDGQLSSPKHSNADEELFKVAGGLPTKRRRRADPSVRRDTDKPVQRSWENHDDGQDIGSSGAQPIDVQLPPLAAPAPAEESHHYTAQQAMHGEMGGCRCVIQ